MEESEEDVESQQKDNPFYYGKKWKLGLTLVICDRYIWTKRHA